MVKKTHTVKNNLIIGIIDRDIKYLSQTHEGKKHDKKICDEEDVKCPKGSSLYRDNGFRGHQIDGVEIYEPIKKSKGLELCEEAKLHNGLLGSIRVVVEHVISGVKRCRVVADVFRNTKKGYDDSVIELACGLHNFRNRHRLDCY